MIVTEGLGGAYPSPTFSPRNWNGTVHYGAAGCSNLRAEVEFAVNSDTALAVGTGVETDPLTGTFDFDATGSYGNSYTWYFGDSLGMMGSGMMTQHVYGAPGIYTVGLVVLDTICGTSDSTSFQVTCTVSMDENGLDQAVRAFPNPSNGQLAIQINGATSFEGSLEIINGVGKVLVNEAVSKQEGRFELPLDLRNLPKGVYTLRLSGDNGQTNLRIVLQ
jgi:PKD repeat protein